MIITNHFGDALRSDNTHLSSLHTLSQSIHIRVEEKVR